MLKQKLVVDFVSKIGIQLFTAISGIFVARFAGPTVTGTLAYATSFVSLFSFITSLFGVAHIKLVSEKKEEDSCNSIFLILQTLSLIIYIAVVLVYFYINNHLLNQHFDNIETKWVILIALATTVIGSVYNTTSTVYYAKLKSVKANIPNLIKTFTYNIMRIIVAVLGYKALALASVNLLSSLLILPIVIVWLKKEPFGAFDKIILKDYIKISIPVLGLVIIQYLMKYSDKLILGHFANMEQIGYYSAAFSVGGIMILIGQSAGTILFPLFSNYIANNRVDEIYKKIYEYERFVWIFIVPLIISISLFSYPIITFLLGEKYAASVPILSVLIFSSMFIMLSIPYGNILSGLGLFWKSSLLYLFQLILFVIVLLVCIHPHILNMGVMSLAITQVTINLFLFIVFYIIAYKKIKLQFLKMQFRYIVYWIIIYGFSFVFLIPWISRFSNLIQLFVFLPLFLIATFFFQILIKLANKTDIATLLSLVDFRKMLTYFKGELKE